MLFSLLPLPLPFPFKVTKYALFNSTETLVYYCQEQFFWSVHITGICSIISVSHPYLFLALLTFPLLSCPLSANKLFYCSQLWRPHLIIDIVYLGRVQQMTSEYIDYQSNYKTRLDFSPLIYSHSCTGLNYKTLYL